MKHFDAQKNSVLLHYQLMGVHRIHGNLLESMKEFTDVSEADARELLNMIKSLRNTDVEDWYDNFWRMFPFSEPTFDNLDEFQKGLVCMVGNAVCSMTEYYGAPDEALQ